LDGLTGDWDEDDTRMVCLWLVLFLVSLVLIQARL
jgi:hypothetical protein